MGLAITSPECARGIAACRGREPSKPQREGVLGGSVEPDPAKSGAPSIENSFAMRGLFLGTHYFVALGGSLS